MSVYIDEPGSFALVSVTVDVIVLRWNNLADGVTPKVQVQIAGGGWSTLTAEFTEPDESTDSALLHITGLMANTAYDVRIRGESAEGNSAWVTLTHVLTLPPAPANLTATPTTYESGLLTWDALPGCTYMVYRDSQILSSGIVDAQFPEAYWQDPETYFVVAVNGSGEGAPASVASAYGAGIVPSFVTPPTVSVSRSDLFTANDGSYAGDPLPQHDSWQWRLYDGGGSLIDDMTWAMSPDFTITFHMNGCTLRVLEGCYNMLSYAYAESADSPMVALEVPTPTNFALTGYTDTTLSLAWDSLGDRVTYRAQWVESSGSFSAPLGDLYDLTEVTLMLETLTPGTSYDLRVRAETPSRNSEWATLPIRSTQLSAPQNLQVTSTTTEMLALAWDALAPGISAQLQWQVYGHSWDPLLGSATSTLNYYYVTSLSSNTAYAIRIRTVADGRLSSEWLTVDGQSTLAPMPSGFTATGDTNGITLSVSGRPANCRLAVWRGDNGTFSSASLIADDVDADSYLDAPGAPGTEYYYFVQYKNSGGYSDATEGMPASQQAAVSNTVPPTIARTDGDYNAPPEGTQLTITDLGSWSGYPDPAFDHAQWQRLVDSTYVDISGATDSSYTVTTDDAGFYITCNVYFSNTSGAVSTQSNVIMTAFTMPDGGGDA